jgi:hypothetical protein
MSSERDHPLWRHSTVLSRLEARVRNDPVAWWCLGSCTFGPRLEYSRLSRSTRLGTTSTRSVMPSYVLASSEWRLFMFRLGSCSSTGHLLRQMESDLSQRNPNRIKMRLWVNSGILAVIRVRAFVHRHKKCATPSGQSFIWCFLQTCRRSMSFICTFGRVMFGTRSPRTSYMPHPPVHFTLTVPRSAESMGVFKSSPKTQEILAYFFWCGMAPITFSSLFESTFPFWCGRTSSWQELAHLWEQFWWYLEIARFCTHITLGTRDTCPIWFVGPQRNTKHEW